MSAWLFDHPVIAVGIIWLSVSGLIVAIYIAVVILTDRGSQRRAFEQRSHVRRLPSKRPEFFDFEAHA